MNIIEENLKKLGHTLPEVAAPVAKYLPYMVVGNRIIVSGQISKGKDGNLIVGTLGDTCSLADGVTAATQCGLYIIAALKQACGGDLSKIKQITRLGGFVSSTADFKEHPQVINGASNLMVDVFGETVGMHARAAVGVSSLPLGVAVEIEAEAIITA